MNTSLGIVWFRNDLRIHDNPALIRAMEKHEHVAALYACDPRWFGGTTSLFNFPKVGAMRAQFILESLTELQRNLAGLGIPLIIQRETPRQIVETIHRSHPISGLYFNEEVTDEELTDDEDAEKYCTTHGIRIHTSWASTLYHFDDLPFALDNMPMIFTEFRKRVEKYCSIRSPLHIPLRHKQTLSFLKSTSIPTLHDLGYSLPQSTEHARAVLAFRGGENIALQRLQHYLWETDSIQSYKETRNGLLGADYSSKFSAWLAVGALSPRTIYADVQQYEQKRTKNDSTYWLIFELIWRDFFRFTAAAHGNTIFRRYGLAGKKPARVQWHTQHDIFSAWKNGTTGIPFIDANMRELLHTGFMSNRGRQNVASFATKDLGLDWRMCAEWFESQLIDYDVCSNYGNWNYVAGVGNDPREGRYFNILRQARMYDPDC